MTMIAIDHSARHAQQRRVESLLTEIHERRRRLYRLKAGGVQLGGLRELKRDVHAVRRELSDVLSGAR